MPVRQNHSKIAIHNANWCEEDDHLQLGMQMFMTSSLLVTFSMGVFQTW